MTEVMTNGGPDAVAENGVRAKAVAMPVTEHLYDVTLQLIEIIDYGIGLDAFSQGETALPPQGARFDFSFAGRISGEKINGSIRGVDYGIVRADGRFDLDLQAQIITDDGEKIAFYADGIFTPPDPVTGIGQVRENVRLITASPRYAWVNKLQIWATGGSNVTTGQIRLKGYIA